MKMFKSYYYKNILKHLVWFEHQNSFEKNINIQQALFFCFLKEPGLKNNNKKNDPHQLLDNCTIFLVFSQYGLACKY